MDHRRIEWLFLIIFTLVSIYLGFEIIHSPVSLSNDQSNGATSIRSEMKSDNIDIPHVTDNPRSGYYLAAKDSHYLENKENSLSGVTTHYSHSDKELSATPKTAVLVSSNTKEAVNKINKFKDDPANVPYGKEFVYEPELSSPNSYVFVQKSYYGKIYSSYAQLIVSVKNGYIDSYKESYLVPVKPVRELQSTISSWRAVQAMYTDRQLPSNSKIIKLNLVYVRLTNVRGSNILLPAWIAWVENKNTKDITAKKVNAFTGQLLQTGSYNVEK